MLKDKARLLPEHLEEWEEDNGSMPQNSVLLVKFGWSKYYSNKTEYLGIDSQDNLNFPGIVQRFFKQVFSHLLHVCKSALPS